MIITASSRLITHACLVLGGPLLRDRVNVGEPRVGLIAGVVAHKQVGHAIGAGGDKLEGARSNVADEERDNENKSKKVGVAETRFSKTILANMSLILAQNVVFVSSEENE